jgi:hypothetical protein
MTTVTFQRLTRFAFLLGAFTLFCAPAFAQTYPIGPSHVSDLKPGSVLFFNRYTSNASAPSQGDTQINITNTNQREDVALHLFFVDGGSCSVADSFVSLTPNQTASFLMSDYDPGIAGYLVAVVVNAGSPSQFNWVIGDAFIRENDGRTYNLPAVAIAKRDPNPVIGSGTGVATLVFDGVDYEQLPNVLALSSFNSQVTDTTTVHLFSPSSDLVLGSAPASSSVFTLVYDDTERAFSTTTRFVCYGSFELRSLRVSGGNLNTIVPAGRTGWVRFNGASKPLLGAVVQRGDIFQGGHNLHAVSTLPSYQINVPAF